MLGAPDPRSHRHRRTTGRQHRVRSGVIGPAAAVWPLAPRKDGTIGWPALQQSCRPIRQAFEATLQRVVELGAQRGERTPWASTVRTCQQLLKVANGLWSFLENEGIEPTNNAAELTLRQSVIQRKISHVDQSRQGAICRSCLLTVTTTLRQLGRDVWQFLEQAWIAHHRGGVMPSLLPDP